MSNTRFKKIIIVYLSSWLLFWQAKPAFAYESGLLMYFPFEDMAANAVNGAKGFEKNIELVEGKSGKGALFAKGSFLRFPAQGNIDYREGTVEMWVKPKWRGDDDGYHYFFAGNISDAKNANSIHLSKKRYSGGVLMGQIDSQADEAGAPQEERAVPGGDDLSPSSVANWQENEWHHIAFSWDYANKTLKLYIDGFLCSQNNKMSKLMFPAAYQAYVNIGSSIDEATFAEAVIDEVKIWDYPRTDMQIADSAGVTALDNLAIESAGDKAKPKPFNFPLLIPVIIFGMVWLLIIFLLRIKKANFRFKRKEK